MMVYGSMYKKGDDSSPGGCLLFSPEPLRCCHREPGRFLRLKPLLSTLLTMAFLAYLLASSLYLSPVFSAAIRYRNDAPVVAVKNGSYAGVYSSQYDQDYFLGMPYAKVDTLLP